MSGLVSAADRLMGFPFGWRRRGMRYVDGADDGVRAAGWRGAVLVANFSDRREHA
ncbi:hypothetical protein [Mycobacteroides abscessus]|uniref:hypothetical protein n=1 Tax=Mycobacteroides abscessus TaxID=36809 RepID=UPI0012FFFE01|nr:hypothetical protein [Mycobacteroides abscessus]